MSSKNRWLVRISFALFLGYVYFTISSRDGIYSFLFLNTILGYIPLEFALQIKPRQNNFVLFILTFLWMLFYPNAPYVLTDLFHLAMLDPYNSATGLMEFNLHLWLNFTNLVASALACSLMGLWSLEHVANSLLAHFNIWNRLNKNILTIALILISSVGIYIGRFLRLHTAYLFLNPQWVVQQLLEMWNTRMLIFVIFMTIIQVIMWVTVTITRASLDSSEEAIKKAAQPKE
ncbi:DUF1361 domain-containing protein [Liquorilactobacillus satsumensis]|uniref:DUF1361 domain-containing protein n=1 Tax=Liquorilactobacillus satsumensis TaxID=259059 RepID=UPI001E486EF1|nr:DUF1361 domain-containing protein [Liquorilactobacillus satsumensis]MCC7667339.1 hypothetical protein [Liquorilactobacillus satsumensis]MCP9358221.1 DUF1361 domain-containing protein [Liquorilactobacillus satsumensis]MCP9371707.1 DUF1361 domain-containing protein [Liquorilactobacillus satsumensis]